MGEHSDLLYPCRHLMNDSDPIVKALDPFQLLPASEDIHEKGLIK